MASEATQTDPMVTTSSSTNTAATPTASVSTTTTSNTTTTTASSSTSTSTPSSEPHEEHQYLSLIRHILSTGSPRSERTGTGTLSIFAPPPLRFSLKNNALPLLTTKKVPFQSILHELLWFISGATSSTTLSPHTKIWDANGSRAALDRLGFTDRAEGDLGPVYGFQWRHFGAEYRGPAADYRGQGVDQLADILNKLQNNPTDRRIILSAWNPKDIPLMALPPCHMFAQFYVTNDRDLQCMLYQRSADMGLGVPFNIASYALLTVVLAHCAGLNPGALVHVLGDAHVYSDHVDALNRQLEREPRCWPSVRIVGSPGGGGVKEMDSLRFENFVVDGYDPWPAIKMKMSV